MDSDERFGKELAECRDILERMSKESVELSERLCDLIEEHDGDLDGMQRYCRSMKRSLADVFEKVDLRLRRYETGDRPALPSVLVLSIDCCKNLFRCIGTCEGLELHARLTSNIGHLLYYIRSMPEEGEEFSGIDLSDLEAIVPRIEAGSVQDNELIAFVNAHVPAIQAYAESLRRDMYWEPSTVGDN
ncbi:MAG: carnosine N-methyltransferase family protein [archaeon]|nr:carnosine N-methyltransferase family protein [archaeon]